jgi:hypothetical protein
MHPSSEISTADTLTRLMSSPLKLNALHLVAADRRAPDLAARKHPDYSRTLSTDVRAFCFDIWQSCRRHES